MSTKKLQIVGANILPQADWDQTDTTQHDYIKNKPTNVSDFTNDAGYLVSADVKDTLAFEGTYNATTNKVATKSFVEGSIADLVNSAPSALDTLDELAAALNDDANFATTVTNALATKAARDTDAVAGNVAKFDANGNPIDSGFTLGMSIPASSTPAGTTKYLREDGTWQVQVTSKIINDSEISGNSLNDALEYLLENGGGSDIYIQSNEPSSALNNELWIDTDENEIWVTPEGDIYGDATTTTRGLMSAADKAKLDGIAAGANNYVHPGSGTNPHGTTKSDLGLGNVENKSSATIRSEITQSDITTALGYTPPTSNTTYTLTQDSSDGHIITLTPSSGAATTITIPSSGTASSTLPVATSSNLGGVKSGTDITVDGSGNVSVNDNSHKHIISNIDELQSALDGKAASSHTHDYIPTSSIGATNGVAELGSDGKILTSQLPSYVDDVLEYSALSSFPATGESGKIYIAQDTNITYRWSGTTYVAISASVALGETSSTAYRGDRGKTAYDHSQATHARTDATAVASSSTNGNITINGTETTVYSHPTTTAVDAVAVKVGKDASGHVVLGAALTAADVGAGILAGQVTANTNSVAAVTTKQVRNIYAGTSDMVAGTTILATGDIYICYT